MTQDTLDRTGRLLSYAGIIIISLALLASAGAGLVSSPLDASHDTRNDSTLVGSMGAGYDGGVYDLSENGTATWSYKADAISYTSVERISESQVLAGYQDKSGETVTTGVRIIDQDTDTVDWEWSFEVETALNSEVHDAEQLPNGNILVADMDRERIVIVNRSTRTTEWQWHASSHYDAPSNPLERDWLHINDVDRIGNDQYLISVRNANQLLVLERGEGVVEVINEDHSDPNDENCRGTREDQLVGPDPQCGDTAVLNHQHNPQWLGGSPARVLVADSENDRVVELERQENGTWTVAWTDYQANGYRYDWPRDADRLPNGNTLILDTRNQRLVEIAPNGSTMWATSIPAQSYAAVRSGAEYPENGTLPHYSHSSGETKPLTQPFESVSLAFGAVQHVGGGIIPPWYTEFSFLATVLGLGVSIIGLWLRGLALLAPALSNVIETHQIQS